MRALIRSLLPIAAACAVALAACQKKASDKLVVRIGHFPNITHAQALVAHALSRQGKGWFEERLGPKVEVQWFVYNAGPTAMEGIINDSVDVTYVGPNPALSAYVKSEGGYVRIISGSALGGAALVVQGDGRIRSPADFRGKRVATPQMGNTQDVACRAWLRAQGFQVTQSGGDVHVQPTVNPDQLALFQQGSLDAVWTVEPWVSRLELEAKGAIFLEEFDALTTVLAASAKFLGEQPELARKLAAAHVELTRWIQDNAGAAKQLVAEELKVETTREIPPELLERAWKRLKFTSEIELGSLQTFVDTAKSVGFLQESTDLSRLVEVPK